MLIIIKKNTSLHDLELIYSYLKKLDSKFTLWQDTENQYLGLVKQPENLDIEKIKQFPFVLKTISGTPISMPKNINREIKIGDKIISRNNFTIIAGPCTIDNREDLKKTASCLKDMGISFLRGGAYKLRSSPYSYQGLGEEALLYMKEVCAELKMTSVSEIISIDDLPQMTKYIDILIVGTRNMQNYRLLSAIGETKKPVILKRGMASTIREWILAAEYISKVGNDNIILCERGIRTFENYTRNTLDISAIPLVQKLTPYPVIVDPSHSSGIKELVKPLSWAAAAAGADGLIIECHAQPQKARCDAQQTIGTDILKDILDNLPPLVKIWNKRVDLP